MELSLKDPLKEKIKRFERSTFIRFFIVLAFISAWVVLHHYTDYSRYLTKNNISIAIDAVREFVAGFGIFGPILFITAGFLAVTINTPTIIIISFSVITFGQIAGAIVSFIIISIAITIIYFVAQVLGRRFAKWFFGKRLKKFEERLDKRGLITVVYLRLVFFMSPVLNWFLCLTNISYKDIFFGTLLGTAHNIVLTVWLSGTIIDLIKAGAPLNPIKTPKLLLPACIGLAIFLTVRIVDRSFMKHKALRNKMK